MLLVHLKRSSLVTRLVVPFLVFWGVNTVVSALAATILTPEPLCGMFDPVPCSRALYFVQQLPVYLTFLNVLLALTSFLDAGSGGRTFAWITFIPTIIGLTAGIVCAAVVYRKMRPVALKESGA